MPSSPSRGPVTTRVIEELKTEGFPVGDHAAPTDPWGWQGEPNDTSSTFIPFMTVTAGPGQPQQPPGAMGDTGTMWKFSYTVFFAGVTRKQCEALADRLRLALCNITRESIITDSGDWRIMKISCAAVGSTNRVGSTYPDYFSQSDTFDVWLTKEG